MRSQQADTNRDWSSTGGAKLRTWAGGKEVRQARRGQGETNERLEAQVGALDTLFREQQRTNELLEWVGGMLAEYLRGTVSKPDGATPSSAAQPARPWPDR